MPVKDYYDKIEPSYDSPMQRYIAQSSTWWPAKLQKQAVEQYSNWQASYRLVYLIWLIHSVKEAHIVYDNRFGISIPILVGNHRQSVCNNIDLFTSLAHNDNDVTS